MHLKNFLSLPRKKILKPPLAPGEDFTFLTDICVFVSSMEDISEGKALSLNWHAVASKNRVLQFTFYVKISF